MYGYGQGPVGDRRRQRSPSPDRYRRDRSPPPHEKRFRGDDYDRGMGYGGRGGGRGGRGGGRGRGFHPDDRGQHRGPRRRGSEPVSFREFTLSLDDSVGAEDASRRYKQYLAEFWGGAVKAEFEERRDDALLRRRFDPRELRGALDSRRDAVRAAAERYASEPFAGALSSAADLSPGPSTDPPPLGPEEEAPAPQPAPVPWTAAAPGRLATDLDLALELVAKLDAEKGIENNPLVVVPATTNGVGDQTTSEQQPHTTEGNAESPEADKEISVAGKGVSPLARLDAAIVYLWVVHAIDYYGARELGDVPEAVRRDSRLTLRGTAPVDGTSSQEAQAEAEGASSHNSDAGLSPPEPEGPDAEILNRIDSHWRLRIERGDAAEGALQKQRVEEGIEAFIDGAIIKHDDNKWGNKLSAKLFVAREFVVKHIRNKHGHVLDSERQRLEDEVFFDNFRTWREAQKKQRDGQAAAAPGGGRGGRGGRGRRGGRFGEATFDPSSGMMGPVMMPGQGAGGQMMPPVIMAPMDMVMGGGRGGGRGRGGREGFVPGPGPIFLAPGKPRGQGYFDLDAPQNNRAVLDYGDL